MDTRDATQDQAATPAPVLTVHPAPETPAAAEIRKGSGKTATVTDALGRVLTLRKLGAMQRLDLGAVLGVHSMNVAVANPCALAFMVTAIDGDPVYQPNTYNEARALVGRLDDEGLEAIGNQAVVEGWATPEGGDAATDAVKN